LDSDACLDEAFNRVLAQMIEISHHTVATISLTTDAQFQFRELPATLAGVLSQADARIHRLDLALRGNSLDYATDQGRVEAQARRGDDGTHRVTVSCNTLIRGSREVGRQICFQMCRRLIARHDVASVFWRPTRQLLEPHEFSWNALLDLPQRFAGPARMYVPAQLGNAAA